MNMPLNTTVNMRFEVSTAAKILGCDAMWWHSRIPVFWNTLLPPSSGYKVNGTRQKGIHIGLEYKVGGLQKCWYPIRTLYGTTTQEDLSLN